jgi:hypothetical protein
MSIRLVSGLLTFFLILASCNHPVDSEFSCTTVDFAFLCEDLTIELLAINDAWEDSGHEPSAGMRFYTLELGINGDDSSSLAPITIGNYELELQDGSIWAAEGVRLPVLSQETSGGWLTFQIPATAVKARALLWNSDEETLRLLLPDPPPPGT